MSPQGGHPATTWLSHREYSDPLGGSIRQRLVWGKKSSGSELTSPNLLIKWNGSHLAAAPVGEARPTLVSVPQRWECG